MQQIIRDAEAGKLPARLARHGVAAHIIVHVTVERNDAKCQWPPSLKPSTRSTLADELNLYTEADLENPKR